MRQANMVLSVVLGRCLWERIERDRYLVTDGDQLATAERRRILAMAMEAGVLDQVADLSIGQTYFRDAEGRDHSLPSFWEVLMAGRCGTGRVSHVAMVGDFGEDEQDLLHAIDHQIDGQPGTLWMTSRNLASLGKAFGQEVHLARTPLWGGTKLGWLERHVVYYALREWEPDTTAAGCWSGATTIIMGTDSLERAAKWWGDYLDSGRLGRDVIFEAERAQRQADAFAVIAAHTLWREEGA